MDRRPLFVLARRVVPALAAIARFRPSLPVLYEDIELVVPSFSRTPTRVQARSAAQLPSASGPKKPSLHKLLKLANKTPEQVAEATAIPLPDILLLLDNRNELFEKWAPVFAKLTLVSRCGLMKMLSRCAPADQSPSTTANASSGASPVSSPSAPSNPTLPTVGQTMYAHLNLRGDAAVSQCKQHLLAGWAGWDYCLDEQELTDFFNGKSEQAETVAALLVKIARATDPSSIFAMFG